MTHHVDRSTAVVAVDTAFARYLRSLVASWEALAAPRPDATVVRGVDFVAARFAEPFPYLNNAVILAPAAVGPAARTYDTAEPHALWCRDEDREIAASLADHGYEPSETTRPMLRSLAELPEVAVPVSIDADLERFANLIDVPRQLLQDVAGLRAYVSEEYDSGLVLQHFDTDVYVSMVFTRPTARGRGLATATLTAALLDARRRGARTASLQSTPLAESLYLRHGFQPVGRWQEWVPADTRR